MLRSDTTQMSKQISIRIKIKIKIKKKKKKGNRDIGFSVFLGEKQVSFDLTKNFGHI